LDELDEEQADAEVTTIEGRGRKPWKRSRQPPREFFAA
jgi:hypothetical protein